jgi:ribulose-5-phosphate 4-epimerase/fuculose-1-phosphate aldolase
MSETGKARPAGLAETEWAARVDLACVYRLIALRGWDEVIYNHASVRVPGEPRYFLIKRHELLYTEVTASNLVKVSIDDDLDERSGVNRPGFTLHSGVLKAREDVNAVIHLHTEHGMALAGLPGGLRMLSQAAMRFHDRIGYHDYEGLTETFEERERIARKLPGNRALIMRHHGLTTWGATVCEAFVLMEQLITAARIQLMMMASGEPLREIPAAVAERTAKQFEAHDKGRGAADWPAYLRVADRIDAGFRL